MGSFPFLSQAPTPVEVELGCDNIYCVDIIHINCNNGSYMIVLQVFMEIFLIRRVLIFIYGYLKYNIRDPVDPNK